MPTVDASDITSIWNLLEYIHNTSSGPSAGVGVEALKGVCGLGVDVAPVWYRLAMVQMLAMMGQEELAALKDNEAFRSTVFKVAARIPLTWAEFGVPSEGLPFDVDAFLEEVRKASEQ